MLQNLLNSLQAQTSQAQTSQAQAVRWSRWLALGGMVGEAAIATAVFSFFAAGSLLNPRNSTALPTPVEFAHQRSQQPVQMISLQFPVMPENKQF